MITLTEATDIIKDENGRVFSWKVGKTLEKFRYVRDFIAYINKLENVDNVMAFTGSASLLSICNEYLKLRREGVLIHDFEEV